MQIITILNFVKKFKSFIYTKAQWASGNDPVIEILVEPRSNSRPLCGQCFRRCPGYDRLPSRRFSFVPLWGIPVFLVYAPRRVDCPRCRIKVEAMPWTLPHNPKSPLTETLAWFLAGWARRLSWKETAEVFHMTWDTVYQSVALAVSWGREHLDRSGILSIGIDEIALKKGHTYITLVYQIDAHCKRLLWIGQDRTMETLHGFFDWLGMEKAPSSSSWRRTCGRPT